MADYNFDSNESHWDHFQMSPIGMKHSGAILKNYRKGFSTLLSIYNTVKDKTNHLDEAHLFDGLGWRRYLC